MTRLPRLVTDEFPDGRLNLVLLADDSTQSAVLSNSVEAAASIWFFWQMTRRNLRQNDSGNVPASIWFFWQMTRRCMTNTAMGLNAASIWFFWQMTRRIVVSFSFLTVCPPQSGSFGR